MKRTAGRAFVVLLMLAATQRPAFALPTMIRLGYSECSACHISPQGGGPLNIYGRGIDRAQSLRGGEYVPATDGLTKTLTLGGRMTEDFRVIIQEQKTRVGHGPMQTRMWPRLMYRNVTDVGKGFRLSGTVTAENESTLRPALSYDPPTGRSSVFIDTALVHYRAGRVELAVGRDQLPSGINIPDLGLWIKSRNRLGHYDAPTQFKIFWTGTRFHVTSFAYGPGGNEAAGERERGVGTIAEFVLGSQQRTVVGTSALNGTAPNGDRRTVGEYVRLGFGRWGIFAQHDVTERTRQTVSASYAQNTSYGQLFWDAREWLVLSATGERLSVDRPFEERALAGKLDLTARLVPQATVGVSARLDRDQITGRREMSFMFQATFKTAR